VRPKQGAGRGAPAEDVRIVLLEAAHAREPRQRAAELVAVQHAKVREPDGQLAVRARAVRKHEAVPCRGALGGGRQRTESAALPAMSVAEESGTLQQRG